MRDWRGRFAIGYSGNPRGRPPKVNPQVLAKMQVLRAAGKPYEIVGGLCGVSYECARRWLTGRMQKRAG